MYGNNARYWYPTNMLGRSFSIVFEVVSEPNITEAILTESNPDVLYNLQDFTPNSFIVGNASDAVELFFVVFDGVYLCDFMIYTPDRKLFVMPSCNIPLPSESLIPRVYSANGNISIYVAQQIKYSQGFAYFRNPECKFLF